MGAVPGLLRVEAVSKRYAATQALHRVDFEVAAGEIHGLLGHNGSGKSTLIKILAGVEMPDAGTVVVRGHPVDLPLKPAESERLGFRFVHQNLGLLPTLSVAENLFLERFVLPGRGLSRPYLNWRRLRVDAVRLLSAHHLDIDPRSPLAELSASQQAQVAILRAVAVSSAADSESRLLVLDEPTVFLPRQEVSELFTLLRSLTDEGTGVVLVSHRIDEVLEHTDRMTVFRDGQAVETFRTADSTEEQVVTAIVGRTHLRLAEPDRTSAPTRDDALVRLRDAAVGQVSGVDLDIAAGEVVGLTGLVGSGYERLLYALFGTADGAVGTVEIAGRTIGLAGLTPRAAMALGIGLVPADRARLGIAPSLSVEENLTMTGLRQYFRGGRLHGRAMTTAAQSTLAAYHVRPPDPRMPSGQLSGGNQQKVVAAKWLQRRPRVLLLHEPTQGVDVSSREEIWGLVRDLAASGSAVLCASTDHEELVTLCVRVEVFADGQLAQTLTGAQVTKEDISSAVLRARALKPRKA